MKGNDMPTTDDPYIASLKAEIEDLKADRDDLMAASEAFIQVGPGGGDWVSILSALDLAKAAVAKATLHI